MISDTPKSMPYNTRRKSLSLPSLGIHLPVTHASRAAARLSPPSATTTAATTEQQPPPKKMKRSHRGSIAMSPAKRDAVMYDHTPPPSPKAGADDEGEGEVVRKVIDLEGINDEIVEGVIVQLQKTGNRPHLVKELAAILSPTVRIVEMSANPSAIISSRLSTYLKRPWTALAPCPLAKELETVHPRRTYFYLTTYPHQPIPDSSAPSFPPRAVISPALSSTASRSDEADEEADADRRRELSPSPEVDLSAPEYDDDMVTPPTPTGSFSGQTEPLTRNHRAASPPLEKDEKEFTQTARGMQKRKLSGEIKVSVPSDMADGDHPHHLPDDSLFDEGRPSHSMFLVSSPAMKPSHVSVPRRVDEPQDLWGRIDGALDWDMRSPENIDMEELDVMLVDF